MNFPQIRAFYHVAAEGGVGRAAQLIGVSQPTISQHIKALEAKSGLKLVEKAGRGLRLTKAGRDLFLVTERLMRAAAEVEDALDRRAALVGGRLRLVSDSVTIAIDLLDLFGRRHPGVEVSVRIASLSAVVEAVEHGGAEVGITCEPPAGETLLIEPIKTEGLYITLPRGHPRSGARQIALADLAQETVILREPGSRTRAMGERALAAAGVSPRRFLEIGAREAIREAVARGLGVTLVSESDTPPDPRLVHRPLAPGRMRFAFEEYLVIHRDRRRVPAVAAFRETAAGYAAASRARGA